jgi:hypothetical protein
VSERPERRHESERHHNAELPQVGLQTIYTMAMASTHRSSRLDFETFELTLHRHYKDRPLGSTFRSARHDRDIALPLRALNSPFRSSDIPLLSGIQISQTIACHDFDGTSGWICNFAAVVCRPVTTECGEIG